MSILISYRNNFSEYKTLQDIAKIKTLSLISLKLTFSYLVGEQSHKLLLNGANSQRKIIFPSCNFLSPLEQPTGNTRNLLHYVNRWSPPPPPDVIYPNSRFKYPSWWQSVLFLPYRLCCKKGLYCTCFWTGNLVLSNIQINRESR